MTTQRTPHLRRHKTHQLGIVTLNGRDYYLGRWPANKRKAPPAVQSAYDRLIAEWLANHRCLPQATGGSGISIAELAAAFWNHVEQHYRRPDGTPTHELNDFKLSLRPLSHLYADSPAEQFGPLALKAVRELMIQGYEHPKYGPQQALARGVINQRIGRIRRMFRWAVENELVSATVLHALQAVRGLERGRTAARETEPVKPVPAAFVEATLPFLLPPVAAMVQLQLLAGMRPGEVTIMRAIDLDTKGKIWMYRPAHHKTLHRGHSRVIAIGPKAQEIIKPFLQTNVEAYLFSPRDAMEWHWKELRSKRKSKVQPSQECRKRKNPQRKLRDHYSVCAYDKAIGRACRTADAHAHGQDPSIPAEEVVIPHWHPHQLRHSKATEIRREAGLDAARAVLGHRSPAITEVYAEMDTSKAASIMEKLG